MRKRQAKGGTGGRTGTRWWWALVALFLAVWPSWVVHAQDADCAEVKIVIEQKLSLERQAFDARMVIRNGLEEALGNVRIELTYLDQNQQPVTATSDPNAVGATFFQRVDRATGIAALDGTSGLAGKTNADIHWLIIPAQGAGGTTSNGQMYYIGAKVTYTLGGEETTVEVTPDYVVVQPQPLLVLDYFLPADVHGDDPMTPEVEPVEPFTLGVRVANVGAGVSSRTTIESAQPKIVENRQGLLIDFRILGGFVGDEMLGKSLLLDFGDIPGQRAKVGRWVMETSLAGRFVEFNAGFTHADSLGGAVTSLIQEVRAHRLVHDVLVDLAGHDAIYDFLAEMGSGYWVYDSDGGDAEVADVSGLSSLSSVSGGNLRLAFPPTSNLVHAKVPDPFAGTKTIVRVVRSDGKVLPAQNAWRSKTRNADLSWSYFLHIFDSNSTGDYLLEFSQSATASLAGSAYRDSNGNGVRDAAEPAEGNLAITLKGVDASGVSVLRQAYTDPSGAFGFAALAPGRYQLEAAVVAGWIDGAWVAGSAGGRAQPGSIQDIVLTAGTAATGYLIAKRRPAPGAGAEKADVSIVAQAARAQLRGNETTDVVVTVRNAGDATAQGVIAQVTIPAGLSLQGSAPSLGSYAGGAWTLGGLEKEQSAVLTLTVKADTVDGSDDRSISWPVSVSAETEDPQTSNNSALLGLTVLADKTNSVELSQMLPAEARVLMLLSCPQADEPRQPACEAEAAQQAGAVLDGRVKQLQTVASLAAWHAEQRSNQFNVLWLHGGADKLDEQALAEIRAAVRRGATVVADGLPGPAGADFKVNRLSDVLGARIAQPAVGERQSLEFPNEPVAQPVSGAVFPLQPQGPFGRTMAEVAGAGVPAMVGSTWGHGQAWTLGFDLVQTVGDSADPFWGTYLRQNMIALAPASRIDPALSGAVVALRTGVRSNAPGGSAPEDVSVRVQLPADVAHGDAVPVPVRDESRLVEWAWHLAPAQSANADMRLALPQASGALELQTTLSDSGGQAIDHKTLVISVIGSDVLAPRVRDTLAALAGGDAAAQALIEQARSAAASADAAQQQGDWAAALEALAALQQRLDALAASPHGMAVDGLRLDVARWMGVVQPHWVPPSATPPAKLVLVSGSGQAAAVSTPFDQPLKVRAVDEHGDPVAGVLVRFALPAAGASARFEGDRLAVDAATDAQGVATSPAFAANDVAGAYSATARVDGLEPVGFGLTNQAVAGGGAPAALRMISGTAQVARVGTAFGAPLVAQVLDAEGQPVSGVPVRYTFASEGASAQFAGGQGSATVVTGLDGLATSPAFSANQVAGTHQAEASVPGVGNLAFALANSELAPAFVLQPVDGLRQEAPVAAAYPKRMIVRLVDAGGQARPGVPVLFTLPDGGPSASFGGGRSSAHVLTAADGTALSPPMVANGQQGAFHALITAESVAQPLYAELANLAPDGSGKHFEGDTATGTGKVTVAVSGGGESCVFNPSVTRLMPPDGIWSPLEKFLLPHGLLEFELVGCEQGSVVTIRTTWPSLQGVTGYLKYGPTSFSRGKSIWYIPSGLRIDGTTVTYTIRDGGLGDDDLSANGIIRDPSGPATGDASPDPAGSVQPIPTLGRWFLLLLSAFVGALAWRRRSRPAVAR